MFIEADAAARKAAADKANADAAEQAAAKKAAEDKGFSWDNIKDNFEEEETAIEDDLTEAKDEFENDFPKYDSNHFKGKNPGVF